MTETIAFFGEHRNRLGESPLWDARVARLYWVDGVARRVCSADVDGRNLRTWTAPAIVGCIALAPTGLLAALADGFYALDFDSGAFKPLALPERGHAGVRFNDGKADRQGRFLAGTMRVGTMAETPAKLYRLEPDSATSVIENGVDLSNAICFSPDGATLYFADSLQARIWAYDYHTLSGAATGRRIFLDTASLQSVPDGATVDAEGHVWVAMVQAQQVVQVTPAGAVIRRIDMPVPYPSCPAFGGAALTTLFVTSLSDSGGAIRTDHPDGGRIMTINGLGVTGLPEAICTVAQ